MVHAAGLAAFFGSAAFWGFVGGVGYSGTRLSTALWGGREISARARRLAVAQFMIALFLSPFAAHAAAPIVLDMIPRATLQATAFLVGLSFNAIWPLLVEPQFLRQLIADLARGLADRLNPGASR